MMELEKELTVCKDLAIKAGEEIIYIYNNGFNVEYKEDKSPLTDADKKANSIIVEGLKKSFPEYAVLAEESKDNLNRLDNDYCFIVDPLDGTKEFVKRNGEYTVNIALSYKKRTILGVIYVPVTGELYYASKGNGAFYIKNIEENKAEKINVSNKTENIRMLTSRSHLSDKLQELIIKNNIKDTKGIGSSLKGCLIARGQAEIYYRFGYTCEWDTAAMQCIIEEAGGVFKQMDDSEMLYNRKNSLNEKGFYILNDIYNKLEIN